MNLMTLKKTILNVWQSYLNRLKDFWAISQLWLTQRLGLNRLMTQLEVLIGSQHRVGAACDFRVPGMTPDEVVKAVIASDIPYDQIIREFDRWTHISVPNEPNGKPRRQALIIDKQGTRIYS